MGTYFPQSKVYGGTNAKTSFLIQTLTPALKKGGVFSVPQEHHILDKRLAAQGEQDHETWMM